MEKVLHYMFLCHKLEERSFKYKNRQFPICARCTGILIGYFIGIILLFFNFTNIYLGIFFIIPLAIDGLGQYYGKWTSNNIRRLITGIFAGIGTIIYLKLAIVLGYKNGVYMSKIIW